ncbi:MAG: carbon-nitrogen hydrolase family protein [Anaerolineae bacterium]|jgi:nitrilase|nr:carbon-nitrogen hydrolase family protein [Anaerolineae bacterium]MBT4312396.1 carbon-nitrogen hydrolase family protein [Anaerolineae bacterium]MBT4459354.1 carbon-nitrogen hydrolase family protein [Anaerolineae bacterium]MBT6062278.1 carbon-nitrogen hydrolase family protein [Anaerolineae bacterium]MBT6320917.1 carbon-nitrogen hydrolase family protein [Anaerolineae bacterium]
MKKKIIAALQLGSSSEGTAITLEKILSYKEKIQQSNCDLLVMPEALLGGYPKGSDFGTRVGYRSDEGREEFLQYWQQAVDLDGPEVLALGKLAKESNTSIVIGVIERSNTTLYCTALFISESGELIAKHRKLMPTASERLIWGQGDGSTIPVVETPAGRVGAAICWENYIPLLRTAMYAKGLEIWCAPTVDDRDIWQASMKHIAYEGRNFLVSACQYQAPPSGETLKDEAWPKDKPLIRGGSVIISPMGEVIAGPLYNEEGLISAAIDLNEIVKARYDMDPTGHYSRPDVFKLIVNEEERPPITIIRNESSKKF